MSALDTHAEPKPLAALRSGRVFQYCFVTGAQKSGTTWVDWMLRAHPQVRVRGEARYLGGEHDATTWIDEERFGAFLDQRSSRRLLEGIGRERLLAAAQRGMVEALLRVSCEPDERTLVLGDRSPFAYCVGVERLHALFPDAVFVDVVRDGRDAAVSAAFMMLRNRGWSDTSYESTERAEAAYRAHILGEGEAPLFGPGQLEFYAWRWAECVRAGERARELFGPRYVQLRYEAMLEDAHGPMKGLFRTLGVRADDEMVERCVRDASFEARSGGRRPGEADSTSFVRKGVAGDWRNYFRPEDARIFNGQAGQALVQMGYADRLEWMP